MAVTNGLFTVSLNFGPGIFSGANYWLQIAVRTNGAGSFTTLSPRQPLLPVPYAIFANTASNLLGSLPSAQLSGTVPSAQITGVYSGNVNFNNFANNFTGVFIGDGAALDNLDAGNLTTGTVADERLPADVALLNTGQTFTGANIFTGVNTFTNLGNSFSGSFFGNGLIGWIPTNGTAIQAQVDHGYVLTNPQLVTVTLPAAANVGDIVRISGAGAGGWRIKENVPEASRSSATSPATATAIRYRCRSQLSPTTTATLPASIDGSRMYAVGNFNGVRWLPLEFRPRLEFGGHSSPGLWQSIACSAKWKNSLCGFNRRRYPEVRQQRCYLGPTVSGTATTSACTADGSKFFYRWHCLFR